MTFHGIKYILGPGLCLSQSPPTLPIPSHQETEYPYPPPRPPLGQPTVRRVDIPGPINTPGSELYMKFVVHEGFEVERSSCQ